jgi:F0F1-type ATP synthase assembly protein I
LTEPTPDPSDEGLGFRGLIDVGALLVGAIVVGTGLGFAADALFGTSPLLTLLGVAAGIVVGCWGSWLQVRRFLG